MEFVNLPRKTSHFRETSIDALVSLSFTDFARTKAALGEELLAEFFRAFILSDRLSATGDLSSSLAKEPLSPRAVTQGHVIFYLSCAYLRELAHVVEALRVAGVAGLLDGFGLYVLGELITIALRWGNDPAFKGLRDRVGVHVDRDVILRGEAVVRGNDTPTLRLYDRRSNSSRYEYAHEVLAAAMIRPPWPGEEDGAPCPPETEAAHVERIREEGDAFKRRLEHVAIDHGKVPALVNSLFTSAIEGLDAGRAPAPVQGPPKPPTAKERLELVVRELDAVGSQIPHWNRRCSPEEKARLVSREFERLRKVADDAPTLETPRPEPSVPRR